MGVIGSWRLWNFELVVQWGLCAVHLSYILSAGFLYPFFYPDSFRNCSHFHRLDNHYSHSMTVSMVLIEVDYNHCWQLLHWVSQRNPYHLKILHYFHLPHRHCRYNYYDDCDYYYCNHYNAMTMTLENVSELGKMSQECSCSSNHFEAVDSDSRVYSGYDMAAILLWLVGGLFADSNQLNEWYRLNFLLKLFSLLYKLHK